MLACDAVQRTDCIFGAKLIVDFDCIGDKACFKFCTIVVGDVGPVFKVDLSFLAAFQGIYFQGEFLFFFATAFESYFPSVAGAGVDVVCDELFVFVEAGAVSGVGYF